MYVKMKQAQLTSSHHATHHIINTDYVISRTDITESNHLSAQLQFLARHEGAHRAAAAAVTMQPAYQ